MNYSKTKDIARDDCIENYVSVIPKNLRDLLIPANPDELSGFCSTIHKLRVREVEREYVMDLQRVYRIPIRPNESVKATMIRVRLKVLKQRLEHRDAGTQESLFSNLPIDPLE